ncbi:MAG TPA: DUF4893 domain-containing protein [Sphingomicrobium sp.]|nr:DUF4893 domain-containing protein [Sphingomicrobium sp.]
MRSIAVFSAFLALAACDTLRQPARMIPPAVDDWRSVATADDRERLRDWRSAFTSALRSARAAGHASEIDREGALLEPDAAIGGVPIANGEYRCRVIKVGAKNTGLLDYVSYPAFACRITQQRYRQHFAKLTGSQRQVGILFPDGAMRQVFLGTMVLGTETRAMQYGVDEMRDVAGFVERIAPNRWRLVMPEPHYESQIDVMELIPSP